MIGAMKLLRRIRTERRLRWLTPMAEQANRHVLRLKNRGTTNRGLGMLVRAKPDCHGAAQILAALGRRPTDQAIEDGRRRLLASARPFDTADPYSAGLTVASAAGVSVTAWQAALLGAIAREFAPGQVLELGTNVGVSSAYIAKAIPGTLTTIEASTGRQSVAKQLHSDLGIGNTVFVLGLFDDVLDASLERIGRVDMAFIDGNHQHQPTLDYFNRIVGFASPGAVFVFDDIRWSEGMRAAWSTLQDDHRFGLVVDFHSFGVCVLGTAPGRIVTPPIVA
jgi:predicted O-methyltransferase YrrM